MFRRRHMHSSECCHYFLVFTCIWSLKYKEIRVRGAKLFFGEYTGKHRPKPQSDLIFHSRFHLPVAFLGPFTFYIVAYISKCRNSIFGGKFCCQIGICNAESMFCQNIVSRPMTDSVLYQKVICHWMTSPLYLYDKRYLSGYYTINTFQSILRRFIIIILIIILL